MKKNIRKIIACALAAVAISSTNTYRLLGNMSLANAATIDSAESKTDYTATIVSVNGKKTDKLVGTTLKNNFSVKDIFNLFGIDTNNIKSITEIKVTASDKEKVTVSSNKDFNLDTTFKLEGASKSNNSNGTQIRIRYTVDGKKVETIKFNISIKETEVKKEPQAVAETSEYSIEYRDYKTNEKIRTTVYVPNEYVQTPEGEKAIPLKVGTVIKEENIKDFLYDIPGYTRMVTSLMNGNNLVINKDSSKNVVIVYYRANK